MSHRPLEGPPWIIRPGAFKFAAWRVTPLIIAHDSTIGTFASTANDSLRMWEDDHGLAFEAGIEPTRRSIPILRAIARGDLCGCSVMHAAGWKSCRRIVDGEEVDIVTETEVLEISLCPEGLVPGASCWRADVDVRDLPWPVAQTVQNWRAGRDAADRRRSSPARSAIASRAGPSMPAISMRGRAGDPKIHVRPPPATLRLIDKLLAQHFGADFK
jgi:HK97 family phage prohead protease